MNALVIGGTRFVGLRLVRELERQGHRITMLNRGKTEAALPAGIRRLIADRRDAQAIGTALAGESFDAVFDFTGYQVRSLEPVVEALAGKIGHYIFQSTSGVFESGEVVPITEDSPLRSPMTSLSGGAAYEVEKVQCENYLMEAYRSRAFPVTILRAPIIYGPENWMHDREFSYFVRFSQDLPVLVPLNGANLTHFLHVDDLAQAHLAAAGQSRTYGQAYNLAGPEAITTNGYLDIIGDIVGKSSRRINLDLSVLRGAKICVYPFAWQSSRYFSIAKAESHFGWRPCFDTAKGLRHTYTWWRESLGIAGTKFIPGKLGYDVDLDYERELAQRLG